ncbi:MAG: L,D-transpeptidase [Cellulosilyticaceae bacterium]
MFIKYILLSFCFIPYIVNASPTLPHDLFSLPPSLSSEDIHTKVQPSPTYGTIRYDCNGFKKGEVVEILEDVCLGKQYKVQKGSLVTWVYADSLLLDVTPFTPLTPMSTEELEYYMNTTSKTSLTPYYVWVDLARQLVYVFEGAEDDWQLLHQMPCASGKTETPTARGTFAITDRGLSLNSTERVNYWVKFYKNYLFHSCPIDASGNVIDSRLGTPISNGCVRLEESDARWLFETLPSTTTVWVY